MSDKYFSLRCLMFKFSRWWSLKRRKHWAKYRHHTSLLLSKCLWYTYIKLKCFSRVFLNKLHYLFLYLYFLSYTDKKKKNGKEIEPWCSTQHLPKRAPFCRVFDDSPVLAFYRVQDWRVQGFRPWQVASLSFHRLKYQSFPVVAPEPSGLSRFAFLCIPQRGP